jgi:hypothetical protein
VLSVRDPDAEVLAEPEETTIFPDEASALTPSADLKVTAPLNDEPSDGPVRISTLPPVLPADDPAATFTSPPSETDPAPTAEPAFNTILPPLLIFPEELPAVKRSEPASFPAEPVCKVMFPDVPTAALPLDMWTAPLDPNFEDPE